MNWYRKVLLEYTNFDGRASRTEFWMFCVFQFLAGLACIILDNLMETVLYGEVFGWVYILYIVGTLLPTLAVQARRLHDSNMSAWFILLAFIPYVGVIALLIMLALEGTKGENRFGQQPAEDMVGV